MTRLTDTVQGRGGASSVNNGKLQVARAGFIGVNFNDPSAIENTGDMYLGHGGGLLGVGLAFEDESHMTNSGSLQFDDVSIYELANWRIAGSFTNAAGGGEFLPGPPKPNSGNNNIAV